MNDGLLVAVVLGIVEGLTEFLPVSSTGHLIVAGNLLGFTGPKADCFEVFIQLGAILAVVVLYRERFMGLVMPAPRAAGSPPSFSGVRGLILLGLTTLPALVVGFFAHKLIKHHLFGPATVALALGLGGIGILLVERFKPEPHTTDPDRMSYGQALIVGLFQCLSMWPGMSRSACTIVGGLLCRMDRKTATEYSFLAAVPVMIVATGYDTYKAWRFLELSDLSLFAVGFVVSFVSAAIAVKSFIALVQRWSLAPYAYYRIIISPLIYWGMK